MKKSTTLVVAFGFLVLTAMGRLLDVRPVKTLVAQSRLAFVGRVKSVRPSGVTTSLSYPTWEKVVFAWLQADVEVVEPIKGTRKGEVVQVAMLSVDERKGPRPMVNAPGMLQAKEGDCFLLFLAPTTRTNLFASLTAPYDDDQAIFRLDRTHWEYSSFREGKEKKGSRFYERHSVVMSLVDDSGQLIPSGAELMRKTYAKEITMAPSNTVIYLQWRKYTNPSGWSHDVPKDAAGETKANGK